MSCKEASVHKASPQKLQKNEHFKNVASMEHTFHTFCGYIKPIEWRVLKVNASATTFCRLFCSGTFWRPKKVADLLASFWCLYGILLEDKKRFATFCCPFPEKRTAKSCRGNFGRQKVAEEKRRQKVVALAFSLGNNSNGDYCTN